MLVMESRVIQSVSLRMSFGRIGTVLQVAVSSILLQVKSHGLRDSVFT